MFGLCYNSSRCWIPKHVLDHFDEVKKRLEARSPAFGPLLDEYQAVALKERDNLRRVEELRAKKNKLSEQTIKTKREGGDVGPLVRESKGIGDEIAALEELRRETAELWGRLSLEIPNIPHETVPVGATASTTSSFARAAIRPGFPLRRKPTGISGRGSASWISSGRRRSRARGSPSISGPGARLERALINFMLDIHTREKGFREVLPPFIANETSLTSTGNLPKFKEDLFKLEGLPWYPIPTAEVPLTNIFRNEILDGATLPQRFVAHTPCFRSEAGSYGKDIRGLIRQHQFNKVEMMIFSLPENSFDELENMTASAEEVLKRLGLAYRVVRPLHGGHGVREQQDLRPRGLDAGPSRLPGDLVVLELRRFPGPAVGHPLPARAQGQAGVRPYAQRLRAGRRPDAERRPGELPAGRRPVVVPPALRPYLDGLERIVTA